MNNIDLAIKHFGGQQKLAAVLNINYMAITQWKRRGIPPRRAKQIADLSGGAIKPSDLLPDIFG